ncbi:hydrolase [Wenjunlia vitaminophila]|uniref:Hydrolase n=1 Tax=Wenjunlia vitaminophila TaxID=76728 RepID=A0A0T6LMS2_WENVI|nr:Cof-type HAD-IIB family hydrolase [Wenjunlia vitaminophila]KRV47233.1 hydrolase [Wenjunlia vitaminophila]
MTSTHRRPAARRTPEPLPRLIATDLDGTLLRSDQTVSPRTVAALAAAEAAGVRVYFVTGRPARWMNVVSDHTARHGIAICANGAAIYDLHGDRLVGVRALDPGDALAVVRALRAELPEVTFAVEHTRGYCYEPDYPLLPDWTRPGAVSAPAETLLASDIGPVLKLLVRHPSLDPDGFLAMARQAAGAHAEFTRSSSVALLEVSATGVSKATTLAHCCSELGIDASEVVAFGDMPNDLEMLAWAGTSYAVANAHPEVLAATTHHTASNDEDGVARVIESLLERRPAP